MIYLDYSATTPINEKVLQNFLHDNRITGNANSPHLLGRQCYDEIEKASTDIKSLLGLNDDYEVIYTSGSSEANNLAIKGLLAKHESGHIITTSFEHSSIIAPISSLQKEGFKVDFVRTNKYGMVDLENLESLITEETFLITIASVNSELGICEPIEEIKKIVKKYPQVTFHVDMTQSIGKIKLNLDDIDMMSFSGHKIYGIKGIGALIKKKDIVLKSQIQGGKSTTKYRSGTPCHPLIMSLRNALVLALENENQKYDHVKEMKELLLKEIKEVNEINQKDLIIVNSSEFSIPHIVNMSIMGKNSIDVVLELEKSNIFISNHSACSSEKSLSLAVYSLTKDEERAKSSIRISLSYLTKPKEIKTFIEKLKEIIL